MSIYVNIDNNINKDLKHLLVYEYSKPSKSFYQSKMIFTTTSHSLT